MKKKVLYFARIDKDDPANEGVLKKCRGQASAFEELGFKTDTLVLGGEGAYLNDELFIRYPKPAIRWNGFKYLFILLCLYQKIGNRINFGAYHIFYLRFELLHPLFIHFISKMKNSSSTSKVVLEIPTFPYIGEVKSFIGTIRLIFDKLLRNKMKRNVDLVVAIGNAGQVFNLPTINLENGYDFHDVQLSPILNKGEYFRIIATGKWRHWHGLDRLIKGMGEHKRQELKRINLRIVGEGRESANLRSLVLTEGIEEWVEFTGGLKGERLDMVFTDCNIGVGSLGLHRIGLQKASPLKNREYIARGLPLIYSGEDSGISYRNPVWAKQLPADDSPVDVQELIEWYNKIKLAKLSGEEIRHFGEANFSWRVFMLSVLKALKNVEYQ